MSKPKKNTKPIVLPAFKRDTTREPSEAEREYTPHLIAMQCGLENYSIVGKKGDLIAILTQGKFNLSGKDEPCLVIAHARNPRERNVKLPLSSMWRMVDPHACGPMAYAFCELIYGFVTRMDHMRMVDAFYEFAEDLKNAPPPRTLTSQEFLTACANDGFVFHLNDQKVNG